MTRIKETERITDTAIIQAIYPIIDQSNLTSDDDHGKTGNKTRQQNLHDPVKTHPFHAIDKNMRIDNVVVEYRDRPSGSESKLNTIPDGIKVLKTIFNLFKNYKPLMFFGYVAAILLLLALGFFIPVWREYLLTGLVERFPTLIVCGSAAIAGILCLFAGIILETLIQKDRQQFEFRLQITEMMYKSLKRDN